MNKKDLIKKGVGEEWMAEQTKPLLQKRNNFLQHTRLQK